VHAIDPLGRVTLNVAFADRGVCEANIRAAAQRLSISFATSVQAASEIVNSIDPHDVAGTVRSFIEKQPHYDRAMKARLLAGFEHLWEEAGS
jgi:hypothetical protein